MASTKDESYSASGPNLKNDFVPELEIVFRRPAELQASKRQVRKVKPKHVVRVIGSIKRFGFCQPVLIKGDELIDGHVRHKAALELGLEKIPVIGVSHLDDDEIRLLRIWRSSSEPRGSQT